MLYIAFVCIFLSIFLFTYNKNHLSKKSEAAKLVHVLSIVFNTMRVGANKVTSPA